MGEAADLEVRAFRLLGQGQSLLEVAARLVGSQRPELGDADVHYGRGAVVGYASDVACRLGRQRRLHLALCLERAREVDAAARQPQLRAGHPQVEAPAPVLGNRVGEPLGHLYVRVGVVGSPLEQPRAGKHDRKLGVLGRRLRRKSRQQPADGFEPSIENQADVAVGKHARRVPPVRCRLRVPDRLGRMPMLLMPASCHAVQRVDAGGVGAAQLEPQEVGEQMVVAKPGAVRVERGDERVCLLEVEQDPLRARAAGHRVGQAPRDPVEDRGPQQELPHLRRLALQHLRHQISRDASLAAGEVTHESLRVRMPVERDRCQPQAGDPALRPLVKQGHRLVCELDLARPQQPACLLGGEAQVRCSYLGQLGREAQAVQVELGLGAARQHQAQVRGAAGDEQLQPPQRLRRLKLVKIVDHQHERLCNRTKVFKQPLDHGLAAKSGRRTDPLDGTGCRPRERVDHRQPEVLRVSFALLDRSPRRLLREPGGVEPRAQQHRLTAARGSADQNDTVGRGRR